MGRGRDFERGASPGCAGLRGGLRGGGKPLRRAPAAGPVAGGARVGRQGALLPRSGPARFPRRFHWSSRRQVGAILKPTGGPGRAAEGEGVRGDWLRLRRQLLSEPGAAAARSGADPPGTGEERRLQRVRSSAPRPRLPPTPSPLHFPFFVAGRGARSDRAPRPAFDAGRRRRRRRRGSGSGDESPALARGGAPLSHPPRPSAGLLPSPLCRGRRHELNLPPPRPGRGGAPRG